MTTTNYAMTTNQTSYTKTTNGTSFPKTMTTKKRLKKTDTTLPLRNCCYKKEG
jgi:hypothetical protein